MKRKYDAEFKRNTVQKVFDGQSVASVSRELGIGEGLIHKWKRAALENGNGRQSGFELGENIALKKRVRELEQENAHSKKGSPHLRQGKLKRYRFIEDEKANYPLKLLCRVMEVSPSGYYARQRKRTGDCPKCATKKLGATCQGLLF